MRSIGAHGDSRPWIVRSSGKSPRAEAGRHDEALADSRRWNRDNNAESPRVEATQAIDVNSEIVVLMDYRIMGNVNGPSNNPIVHSFVYRLLG